MLSKTKLNIIILAFFITASGCVTLQVATPQQDSYQVFYDNLSPYGDWINDPDYGYVWAPNVSPGFTPYSTNGYWLSTDDGWTWVSNYSWGWAPFHYGRWYYDSYYGWLWVPGNEWAPAWVVWRSAPEYYGWAPLGPGVSVDYGYSDRYTIPNNYWRFVRDRDFGRRDMNDYYVSPSNNGQLINNSRVVNNFREDKTRNVRYNGGPDRNELEQRVGKKIAPVPVTEGIHPGETIGDGRYQIYKPRVQQNNSNGSRPAPSRVTDARDLKPNYHRDNDGDTRQQNNQPVRPQDLNNRPVINTPRPNLPNDQPKQNIQPANQLPNTSNQTNNTQKQPDPPVRQRHNSNEPGDHNRQQNQSPANPQPGVNQSNNQTSPANPPVRTQQKPNEPNNQSHQPSPPVNQQPSAAQPNTTFPPRIEQLRQQQRAKEEQQRLQTNTNQHPAPKVPATPAQHLIPTDHPPQTQNQQGNGGGHLQQLNQRKFTRNDSTREKKE